jgi:hypothetical protein
LRGEWFPSLFHLPIFPLGAVSVPGLCVSSLTIIKLIKPRKKEKKEKERKKKEK